MNRKSGTLKRRVILLGTFSALMIVLIFGLFEYFSSRQSIDRILQERLLVAKTIAANIDYLLRLNLSSLQEAGYSKGVNLADKDISPEKAALHLVSIQSICSSVFFLDAERALLWSEPRGQATRIADAIAAQKELDFRKPAITNLFEGRTTGQKSIFLIVPVPGGFIGGVIDPTGPKMQRLLENIRIGSMAAVQLLDKNGYILAATDKGEVLKRANHTTHVSASARSGQPQIYFADANGDRNIVALAPLSVAPWTIQVSQREEEALGSISGTKGQFILFALVFFIANFVLTRGLAQSVIRPVLALTESAERIASGNLTEPVVSSGDDEMNRMGRTLDDMRVKLKDSMEQVARYNRELEARVEKRTAEVTLLYEELKVKEQLREELLRKTISAQEEERKRIARELHDDLSQTLTAILLSLKSGAATPSRNAAEEAVVRAIDSIHRMIYDLRPSILDDLGLPAAIRSYAENRLRPLGISVRFEGDFQEERLPGQMEIALFRIAQEAISNIARHSRAEIAVISLERLPHSIRLEIEDDGEGFNIDQKEGYGLLGISERAALLGGTIEVETAPDAGTRITVQAPLAQQEVVHG